MLPRLLSALLAALLLLVAAPVASADPVPVDHVSFSATDTGPEADTILGPGDVVDFYETLRGGSPTTLHNLEGTLTSQTAGATVTLGFNAFADLGFGAQTTNAAPYRISLAGITCGTAVELNLRVTADGYDAVDIPLTMPTGTRAPGTTYVSPQVPRAIPIIGTAVSNVDVADPGLAKRVTVTIGDLDHTYDSDLRISLQAPSGKRAILLDHVGADQDDITNATFVASGGVDAAGATPPYTGLKLNAPQLAKLDGEPITGRWQLIVEDTRNSDSGVLNSWSLNLAPATCEPVPIASFTATPNPVDPGQNVTLDATESVDPTDAITSYEWDLDGDGQFDDATGVTTTASWASPQRVPVGLRITAGGQTDVATVDVAVTGAPDAVLGASSTTPLSGVDVTLDAGGTIVNHPNGGITQYDWDLDGDQIYERSTVTATTTVKWLTAGLRTVRVRVTDDFGATDTASIDVDVQNRAPTGTLEVVPAPIVAGQTATLSTPDEADVDGTIANHRWDADGDGAYEGTTGTGSTYDFVYSTPGTYTAAVEIRDNSGGTVIATQTVTVVTPNALPTALLSASPQTADPNESITLSAAGSSDPDGTIAEYRWDTDGDGSYETSTNTTATKTVSVPIAGTFPVRVKVIDDRGGFATKTLAITIRGNDPPPTSGGSSTQTGGGTTTGGGAGTGTTTTTSPPAGGDGGAGGTPRAEAPAFTAVMAGTAIQKLKGVSSKGIAVSCLASDRGRCIVVATIGGADAKRLGLSKKAKAVQVGRATVELTAGKRVTLRVRLSAAARRALKRRPSTRIVLYGVARDWFGHSLDLSRTVLVRR